MPGYKHFVEIEVLVDAASAGPLTKGADALDEILILHLENGRDIFLTVGGSYRPSCFGCDLWTLCHSMRPVKDLTAADLRDCTDGRGVVENGVDALSLEDGGESTTPQHAYDIPKELWVMVDHIFKYGVEKRDIFMETSDDPSALIRVRDFLDSYTPDVDLPSPESSGFGVDAVANALTVFLKALPEPIIPFRLYDKCLAGAHSANDAMDVVQQLPSFHRSSFQYIVAFLNELLHHRDKNGLDRVVVGTVFGELMIRSPVVEDGARISSRLRANKKMQFLSHFLDSDVHDVNTY